MGSIDTAIVANYVKAVKAQATPAVTYSDAVQDAIVASGRDSIAGMLAYSILPLRADGTLASKASDIALVAMPHVVTRDNAVSEKVKLAMRAAGFTASGFAGRDTTPETRVKAAMALASRLVAMGAIDTAGKAGKRAPKPATTGKAAPVASTRTRGKVTPKPAPLATMGQVTIEPHASVASDTDTTGEAQA